MTKSKKASEKGNSLLRGALVKAVHDEGESQRAIAKKYGFDSSGLHLLLTGKRGFSLPGAIRIANAFNIDLGKIQRECQD